MTGCVRLRVEGLMLEKLTARALNEGARFSRLTCAGAFPGNTTFCSPPTTADTAAATDPTAPRT